MCIGTQNFILQTHKLCDVRVPLNTFSLWIARHCGRKKGSFEKGKKRWSSKTLKAVIATPLAAILFLCMCYLTWRKVYKAKGKHFFLVIYMIKISI